MGSYRSLDASGNNASGGANLVGPQVYVEEFQTEMWFATSAVGLAVIILQNMIGKLITLILATTHYLSLLILHVVNCVIEKCWRSDWIDKDLRDACRPIRY